MPAVIRQRKHGPPSWTYQKIYCLGKDDSLERVRWVERFVLGQTDLQNKPDNDQQLLESYQIEEALKVGKLIGMEQCWLKRLDSDNRIRICKYVGYHIGFETRPDGRSCKRSLYSGDPNKVEKYVVGSTNFIKPKEQFSIDNQISRLNKALSYGRIIARENNYTIGSRQGSEHTIASLVYHVGFKYKLS